MKTFIIILTMLVAGMAGAQTPKQIAQNAQLTPPTKAPPSAPKQNDHNATTVLPPKLDASAFVIKTEQPNEIKGRKVVYSGVVVQTVKSKEPWQLINPLAPAEYGSGHQNLDRDIITGEVTGFKFFSISF